MSGYSPEMAASKGVWDVEALNNYLAQPTQFLPGTWMDTAGIVEPHRRAEIIAYVMSLRDVSPQ